MINQNYKIEEETVAMNIYDYLFKPRQHYITIRSTDKFPSKIPARRQ